MSDQRRAVWWNENDRSVLQGLIAVLAHDGKHASAEFLQRWADAYDDAPDDAVGAVESVLLHLPSPLDWDPTDSILHALRMPA